LARRIVNIKMLKIGKQKKNRKRILREEKLKKEKKRKN